MELTTKLPWDFKKFPGSLHFPLLISLKNVPKELRNMFLETAAPEKKTTFYKKFELLHSFLGIAALKKDNLSVAPSTYYCFENLLTW